MKPLTKQQANRLPLLIVGPATTVLICIITGFTPTLIEAGIAYLASTIFFAATAYDNTPTETTTT